MENEKEIFEFIREQLLLGMDYFKNKKTGDYKQLAVYLKQSAQNYDETGLVDNISKLKIENCSMNLYISPEKYYYLFWQFYFTYLCPNKIIMELSLYQTWSTIPELKNYREFFKPFIDKILNYNNLNESIEVIWTLICQIGLENFVFTESKKVKIRKIINYKNSIMKHINELNNLPEILVVQDDNALVLNTLETITSSKDVKQQSTFNLIPSEELKMDSRSEIITETNTYLFESLISESLDELRDQLITKMEYFKNKKEGDYKVIVKYLKERRNLTENGGKEDIQNLVKKVRKVLSTPGDIRTTPEEFYNLCRYYLIMGSGKKIIEFGLNDDETKLCVKSTIKEQQNYIEFLQPIIGNKKFTTEEVMNIIRAIGFENIATTSDELQLKSGVKSLCEYYEKFIHMIMDQLATLTGIQETTISIELNVPHAESSREMFYY